MQLTKHHGLGNDFLITWVDVVPDDAAQLAVALCERHTGLGADGLIFGVGAHPVQFVLFNADGSQPEVSGNGLRCFGQALARREGAAELDVTVSTIAGPRRITIAAAESDDPAQTVSVAQTVEVAVDMGATTVGPDLAGRDPARHIDALQAVTVDIGNPHVVIEVADPMSYDMAVVGPLIEADFMPTGINVHLIARSDAASGSEGADGGIVMNIWERGAGVTQACGSGACAAAVAAHQWGWGTADTVGVTMPGGRATITVGDTLRLQGPSAWVGDINVGDIRG